MGRRARRGIRDCAHRPDGKVRTPNLAVVSPQGAVRKARMPRSPPRGMFWGEDEPSELVVEEAPVWGSRGGRGEAILRRSRQSVAPAALAGVVGGLAAWAFGAPEVADGLWAATTALLLVPLTASVVRSLLRGDVGVDAIALVSMAGALALGEYLAGAVVALMLAGGNALEERANRRAARELTSLIERAPRSALVRRGDGLVEVPVGAGRPR